MLLHTKNVCWVSEKFLELFELLKWLFSINMPNAVLWNMLGPWESSLSVTLLLTLARLLSDSLPFVVSGGFWSGDKRGKA